MNTDHTETPLTETTKTMVALWNFTKSDGMDALSEREAFDLLGGLATKFEQELAAARASVATLTAQRDEARKKQPINTSLRLFDLVRFMRSELLDKQLITEEEYGWLAYNSQMATGTQGGSPSRQRLEDYDALRARNDALTKALEDYMRAKLNADMAQSIYRAEMDECTDAEESELGVRVAETSMELFNAEQAARRALCENEPHPHPD